jgi:hypothetical protein
MFRHSRLGWKTAAIVPIACIVSLGILIAQPPDRRPDGPVRGEPAKLDKDVEAWIKLLAGKIADRHDTIRQSAREALAAVGPAALPALRKLAEGDDSAAAAAARSVIARIERGPRGEEDRDPERPGPGGDRVPGGDRGPGGPGRGQGVREALDRTIRELGLNPEQQKKATAILEAHHEAMRGLHEKARNGDLDREAMMAAHKKQTDEFLTKLKAVLSDEQLKKLSDALPMGPGGPRGPGGRGPGGPGDRPRPDQPEQPEDNRKSDAGTGGIQWYATWESGLKEAERTARPILLVSAAPHCAGVSGTW